MRIRNSENVSDFRNSFKRGVGLSFKQKLFFNNFGDRYNINNDGDNNNNNNNNVIWASRKKQCDWFSQYNTIQS